MKKPTTTDEYLVTLPADQYNALEKLRKQILSTSTVVEEYFGYGLPGFKAYGHAMLYMGAAKKHCALYGMIPPEFAEDLKGFKTSKGAIQFTPEKPITTAMIKAIVKAKVKENKEKWG